MASPFKQYQQKAAQRLEVCGKCPKFKDGRCALCGCKMAAKVLNPWATCPDKKWE